MIIFQLESGVEKLVVWSLRKKLVSCIGKQEFPQRGRTDFTQESEVHRVLVSENTLFLKMN